MKKILIGLLILSSITVFAKPMTVKTVNVLSFGPMYIGGNNTAGHVADLILEKLSTDVDYSRTNLLESEGLEHLNHRGTSLAVDYRSCKLGQDNGWTCKVIFIND